MPSRRIVSTALLALLLALVAGAALATPAASASSRDDLMKTALISIQAGVEKSGAARMYVYPHPNAVALGKGLPVAFWPRDPWTGRRLTPGSTRGHYRYTRGPGDRTYTLIGFLSGGKTFTVEGRMPFTPMLAYDHRGEEGLSLIFQYVRSWSLVHEGRLPTAAQVTRDGAVGRQRYMFMWPSNPWDHLPMQQRADKGSFAYSRSGDGDAFTLTLHRATKPDLTLKGTAAGRTAGGQP